MALIASLGCSQDNLSPSTDAAALDAATATTDGVSESDRFDENELDSRAGEGGPLCTANGMFPGAATLCENELCPAGCACIEEGTPRHFACVCIGFANLDGGPLCVTPTCGTIVCEPPMMCFAQGSCQPPEGGDASALDGGPLCSNDSGVFPGMPGTCGGQSCSPGCACIATATGGACFCPTARDAGAICVAPACGTIFCESGCTCIDAVSGTCECP